MSNVETLENKQVIVLEQKPIISYDLVEAKGKEVSERIKALNLEAIEPTEDNLKLLKTTRTELKKEFEVFENQRKMVKDMVMKPYNDFDASYKEHISTLFKDADLQLKDKVSIIDDEVLQLKIDGIKSYFDEVNTYDFLKFEDLELKIIKSISDKKLKEEITNYLLDVAKNIGMIDTLENKDRILVKYQMHKDLNRAISETQMEVKREAEIKAQKEAREKARLEHEERQKQAQVQREAQQEINEEIEQHEMKEVKQDAPVQKFKVKFEVVATKEEIAELKKYMNDKGLNYENIK